MGKKQQKGSAEPSSAPELSDLLAKQLAEHTKHDAATKKSAKKAVAADTTSEEAPARSVDATDADTSATSEDPALDPAASIEDLHQAYEDAETDAAVDEIVKDEADEVLAHEDAARQPAPAKPRGFWGKIGHFFAQWWRNKWARWITILLILGAIGTVVAIPQTRYLTLNTLGVRSGVSLRVVDIATQLPLKNVRVSVAGSVVATDDKGVARFDNIKLGPQTVEIKRIAFAPITKHFVVGWGSNPLGTYELTATGIKYVIDTHDYLSDKGVTNAQADSGQASAVADSKGIITLVLDDDTDVTTLDVAVSANGYRTEHLQANLLSDKASRVVLVPAARAVFLSKQSGRYDVIRSDIDGKNRKVILAGTGTENNNLTLAVDDSGQRAALVSTRDNVRDSDGYLLSTIAIIDTDSEVVMALDHAEQIQLIDWIGTRIVYEEAIAGASASNPQRYRLISYDYETNNRVQLASANQFNAVLSAQGMIYYAASNTEPGGKPGFARIKPDGSGRQTVLGQETWSAFRTDYNTVSLQTPAGWYTYDLAQGQSQKATPPAVFQSQLYSNNNAKHAWIEARDGKNALQVYDSGNGKNTLIAQQGGMGYPLRWLNDTTLIYRIATQQEVADYAVSTQGGQPKKISDVTNSYGFAQAN